jgi:hypothetical protein
LVEEWVYLESRVVKWDDLAGEKDAGELDSGSSFSGSGTGLRFVIWWVVVGSINVYQMR